MSLAINTATPEGLVLAADSRQSYRNRKGVSRIGSDAASKLFLINDRIGVAVTGLAFLQENGIPKNISKFIEQYKREVDVEKLSVREIAEKLHRLFEKKLDWEVQLEKLPEQIKNNFKLQGMEVVEIKKEQYNLKFKIKDQSGNVKDGIAGIEGLVLFVAGYNIDGSHEVYNLHIPGEVQKRRDSKEKGMEYGSNWVGQGDVSSRVLKGWDPRIFNAPLMNELVKNKGQAEIEKQLNGLEYSINWGAMTLQDAIDFAILTIQRTSAIQRFSDGIAADPGDVPGVGGPVDVLVLKPDGPQWIQKKELKGE